MARKHMLFDKTEIVVMFMAGNKFQTANLQYSDIQRIQFDPLQERKLFSKVQSEKITLVTGKRPEPIVYTMLKEKAHWGEYKEKLQKFAERNTITFVNNLPG